MIQEQYLHKMRDLEQIMNNEKLVIEQESYISDALEKAERIQNALDSY